MSYAARTTSRKHAQAACSVIEAARKRSVRRAGPALCEYCRDISSRDSVPATPDGEDEALQAPMAASVRSCRDAGYCPRLRQLSILILAAWKRVTTHHPLHRRARAAVRPRGVSAPIRRRFDEAKLRWLNGVYIPGCPELARRLEESQTEDLEGRGEDEPGKIHTLATSGRWRGPCSRPDRRPPRHAKNAGRRRWAPKVHRRRARPRSRGGQLR